MKNRKFRLIVSYFGKRTNYDIWAKDEASAKMEFIRNPYMTKLYEIKQLG